MSEETEGGSTGSGKPESGFSDHLEEQLLGAIWCPNPRTEEMTARYVKAAIDRLNDIRPEGAVEGMLAVQMIATHDAAMNCFTRAMDATATFEGREMNLKHATKLMAIYERQLANLDKRRGRGQQSVTVKYVHVAEGGQAIVGNVAHGERGKAPEKAAPQALAAPNELPMEIPVPTARPAPVEASPPERHETGPEKPSGKRRPR